jgi:lipooligosaccharide transport system ATP-binding protein
MHRGRKIMEGAPRTLLAEHVEAYVLEMPAGNRTGVPADFSLPSGIRSDLSGQTARFYADQIDPLKALADRLEGMEYFLRQTNLEDVFLRATGRTLNDKQ